MLHGHGNDIHNYKDKIIADFSSNVWYEGPSPILTEYLSQNILSIKNYPEPDSESLAKRIQDYYCTPNNSCIITNGSVEAFYLIAQALKKHSTTIICPTFAEYEDACNRFSYKIELASNEQVSLSTKFNSDLIWLCNPNNPDGKVFGVDYIENWLQNNEKSLFIVDEAYAELCHNFKSAIPLLKKYNNLIVVKSFTKSYAIPGLRLGFLLASPKTILQLKSFQLPWSVNNLSALAGEFILINKAKLSLNTSEIQKLSQQFQEEINNLNGYSVTFSPCNYFLVKIERGKAALLKKYLIEKYGLLIRDASNFRHLTQKHVRIALQSSEMNKKLISALREWNSL